jgi:hypothetical protein
MDRAGLIPGMDVKTRRCMLRDQVNPQGGFAFIKICSSWSDTTLPVSLGVALLSEGRG